jgi:hypothetical protein
MDYVDATMGADLDMLVDVRQELIDAIGERGLVDSAGVMAMFQLNTRAADAAGILVEDGTMSGRNKVGELFGFDSRPDGRAP